MLGTNDKSTKSELLKWKTFEIQRDSARSRQKFYPIKKVLHDMTLLGPKEGSILPSVNLTLSLPRSSIDDLVFSVFTSNFVKLSYKISLIKYRFVTLFLIRFS